MSPSLTHLKHALRSSWPVESPSHIWADWSPTNPARGQCVPTALVVQDYFGGDLVRVRVHGEGINETHYYNQLLGGSMLDLTRSQYQVPVRMNAAPIALDETRFTSTREKLLADPETRERYHVLSRRVTYELAQLLHETQDSRAPVKTEGLPR